MTTTIKTVYGATDGGKTMSLAQARAAEIEKRIAAFDIDIERQAAEIDRANALLHADWRTHAQAPAAMASLTEDIARQLRTKQMTEALRDGASAEIVSVRKQIAADRILKTRAAFDAMMRERVSRSRDLIAVLHQLAAIIQEIEEARSRGLNLFSEREETGLSWSDAKQVFDGREQSRVQDFVEETMSFLLDRSLWKSERPVFGFKADTDQKLVKLVDRQRLSVLAKIDAELEQVTGEPVMAPTPPVDPADAAAASMHATQARAGAYAAANGIA